MAKFRTADFAFKIFPDGRAPAVTVSWAEESSLSARPIALIFHGGGFVIGSRRSIHQPILNDLMSLGFVAVSADYSLCPQVSLNDGPLHDARTVYKWCKKEMRGLMLDYGVKVDPAKIAAMGFSAGATLALCLASEEEPPVALLDFYGPKYFDEEFWRAPLPMPSQLPAFPESFLSETFMGPIPTCTELSLEKLADESSKAANGRPRRGIPKPDLSISRNAWLFTHLKEGTHLQNIVQDGNYRRVDPVTGFSHSFPPTMFIHGDADMMVPTSLSSRAHFQLQALGVKSELVLVPNASHGFEIGLLPEELDYQCVAQGIEFLRQHVLV